jgi:hypothetical protein
MHTSGQIYTPAQRSLGAYWVRGYMGHGTGVQIVAKRQVPALARYRAPISSLERLTLMASSYFTCQMM